MQLTGKRTYLTGAVIVIIAVLQYFKVINFDQQTFETAIAALGGLAAIFLRAGVNGK